MQALKPSSQLRNPLKSRPSLQAMQFVAVPQQSQSQKSLQIRVDREKALVLQALLNRINNDSSIALIHPAERKVLWDLEYMLQNGMPELASPDYDARLALARENTWPRPTAVAGS